MSSKQCPLCGNAIKEDEDEPFCSDCRGLNEQCGEFSRTVFSKPHSSEGRGVVAPQDEEAIPDIQDDRPSSLTTNSQKRKRMKIWIIALCVLILSGIVAGGYSFLELRSQDEHQELAFWNNALRVNTSKSYMDYIHRYPDGKYVKDAQDNILRYNDSLRKLWDSIKRGGSEGEILFFVSKYAQTPYAKEASAMLDSVAWANALQLNTQESYKSYLERTEKRQLNGIYKALAQEKYDYLAGMEFVGGEEWNNVENVLATFFRELSSEPYLGLRSMFAETVKQFYTLKDVSPEVIIASIKDKTTKEDISAMHIVPDANQMQVKRDNKGNYIIHLTAQKEISYAKSKEKSIVRSQFFIVLDSAMKVVELNELKQ